MTAYLALLARRALQPAAIRPRVLSRFESDAAAPGGFEIQNAEAAAPAPLVVETPARPLPQATHVMAEVATAEPPAAAHTPQSRFEHVAPLQTTAAQMPLREATAFATATAAQSIQTPAAPQSALHTAAQPVTERIIERIEQQHSRQTTLLQPILNTPTQMQAAAINAAAEPIAPRIEHHTERLTLVEPRLPAHHASPLQAAAPIAAAPAGPTVEISIGRIEILPDRAPAPVAAATQAAPGKPAAQSLDDYLQTRSGRRA
ncbi:hypothetical protein [Amantichitinum ursilacus]|uniref:Uncharacterized protein n=1 Tax=Amantichitinum ursilacus TaxID=857265 RepID=A0A0N0GMP6_9NEIS|nr:hypothetical protein [Amantichitinum ursilacus]KPC51533.1 hypothetical protein WG78_15490 [Amantichitinum ursilacus]